MKMPWGKYRGQPIEDVPTDYLQWMAENISSSDELIKEAENQLKLRRGEGVERTSE